MDCCANRRIADELDEFMFIKMMPRVKTHGERTQRERDVAPCVFCAERCPIMMTIASTTARGTGVRYATFCMSSTSICRSSPFHPRWQHRRYCGLRETLDRFCPYRRKGQCIVERPSFHPVFVTLGVLSSLPLMTSVPQSFSAFRGGLPNNDLPPAEYVFALAEVWRVGTKCP